MKVNKVKFERLYLDESNVKMYIDLLKDLKHPFTLEMTNYTSRIKSPNYNLYFLKTEQSNQTFAASAKIKKDLKNKIAPDIDFHNCSYYDTNFPGEFYTDLAHMIDIKSAYANILYNDGFITRDTFNYISRLPKMARLAATGMIASRKEIFHHSRSGAIIKMEETINPMAGFFYHCVKRTSDIMTDLKNNILGNHFLFSWVDACYFQQEENGYLQKIVSEYLQDVWKLKSTHKVLTEFECRIKKDSYKLRYFQEGKIKTQSIPLPETNFKKKIANHLLTKKYN